ncbi:MAG: ligase-associated DNA damage response endonuclease PdeM [Pseudomonadota bacterium]
MSVEEKPGFGMSAMGAFSVPGPKSENDNLAPQRPAAACAKLAGIDATLDASGAVWWANTRTLIVSDLHLETGSSYARSGQMLPPYDTALTLARLAEAVGFYLPRRIIALGDSFHDPFGAERLNADDRDMLIALCGAAEMVWIEGNHDHDSAHVFGGTAQETYCLNGVTFRHIPTESAFEGSEVAGHLHPAARITVRGRTLKRRAFIGNDRRLVLPAFGCLTGGLAVNDPAFSELWSDGSEPRVHMIGSRGVYAVPV